MIYTPLEQFEILPLFIIKLYNYFLCGTNISIAFIAMSFLWIFVAWLIKPFVDYTVLEKVLEYFYLFLAELVYYNFNNAFAFEFFPLIFTLFAFICVGNVLGLFPLMYTVTSQFILAFNLSLIFFGAINIFALLFYNQYFYTFFIVKNVSGFFVVFMFIIELLSFYFRLFSLALRLFINMMAGHALLKIFAMFTCNFFSTSSIVSLFGVVPATLLLILFVLEIVVALLQAYVFTILVIIYLNEIFALEH